MSKSLADAINLRKKVRSDGKRVIIDNFSPDKLVSPPQQVDDPMLAFDMDWKEMYLNLCNDSHVKETELQCKHSKISELSKSISLKQQRIDILLSSIRDMQFMNTSSCHQLELYYYKLLTGMELLQSGGTNTVTIENETQSRAVRVQVDRVSEEQYQCTVQYNKDVVLDSQYWTGTQCTVSKCDLSTVIQSLLMAVHEEEADV